MFLHNQKALLDADDVLEIGMLVARVDDEAARVGPHLFVDAQRHGDPLGAGIVGAFADEIGEILVRPRPVQLFDALVDLAKERLVTTGTFFPEGHAV